MKTKYRRKYFAVLIPYLAVFTGLYLMSNVWVTMIMYHVGILTFMISRGNNPSWRTLLNGWHSLYAIPLLIVCALNGVAIYFAFPNAGVTSSQLAAQMSAMGVHGGLWIVLFVYYVSVTPWLEELFWRGHLGSSSSALAATDLLFGGYHVLVLAKFLKLPWVGLSFVTLVAVAWLWRQVKNRCGGLIIPVVTHLVADASTMVAVYLLAR